MVNNYIYVIQQVIKLLYALNGTVWHIEDFFIRKRLHLLRIDYL